MGDVVIIHDEDPCLKWKLVVIEEITQGRDGQVRSSIMKTSNITTFCPVAKLYPLEIRVSVISSSDQYSFKDEETF